ncbi:MAG: ergothioneine biosynthesis protein EgtB [Alphaproteobacteria bacterium]|nr:ergothioneine biosynthesis protein EgtB [Alphaproteobacteria bacterium]
MSAAVPGAVPLAAYAGNRALLLDHYARVRATTEQLAAPLSDEDQVVQSMPDASPTKWHRGHVTWFFETVVLKAHDPAYRVFHPRFGYFFNSYYEALGARQYRPERGLLTRPANREVTAYRAHVDAAMARFAATAGEAAWRAAAPLVALGLHHEQQHQELVLMDILHAFSRNALFPAYQPFRPAPAAAAPSLAWIDCPGGEAAIGHGGGGFAYDNEGPRHRILLAPYRLASRCVTNAEWLAFMADGGYRTPTLWLSDGWVTVQREGWDAPAYWHESDDGAWSQVTLAGLQPVDPAAPACHVGFYEADAYARWAGARLPTEAEWEAAAAPLAVDGNFLGSGLLRPRPAPAGDGLAQIYGDVWEWTASAYAPYPGFRPIAGAVGEYNGKFMVNQLVLRGGSCATPDGHVRPTYRNFFYPHMRWQFAGLRLAADS